MRTLKHIYLDIQDTAKKIASLGDFETAARAMQVTEALGAQTIVDKKASTIGGLEPIGVSGWWSKPHNLVLASSKMGWSLWTFTILPYFPAKRAARLDLNGIVIRPVWRLSRFGPSSLTPQQIENTVATIKEFPSIASIVSKELDWVEREFELEVPKGIRDTLVGASPRQAVARWGSPHWETIDRLIPLDGAMPRDLP
jgi:hypothetical protein